MLAHRELLYALLTLAALAIPAAADEPTIDEAITLLRQAEDDSYRRDVEQWDTLTKASIWKDNSGEYSVDASYIDASEDAVTLQTGSGRRITVPLNRLDFNAKVKLSKIGKLKTQLIEHAKTLKTKLAVEEAQRREREEVARRRREYEQSLTPEQRQIRAEAMEMSHAGSDRERALFAEMESEPGREEDRLRLRANVMLAMKVLEQLCTHFKNRTLTDTVVKQIVNESGGPNGAIRYLEGFLFNFDVDGGSIAKVLVEEDPLITRLDVYYAAGRILAPQLRKAYGFHHIELFERMGKKLYWDYILQEKQKS